AGRTEAELFVQLVEGRRSTDGERDIRSERVLSRPLVRGKACVALVEPTRRHVAQVLVERHVRELVADDFARIAGIRPCRPTLKDDTLRLWKRDRGAPLRRRRTDPFAESFFVGGERNEDLLARTR